MSMFFAYEEIELRKIADELKKGSNLNNNLRTLIKFSAKYPYQIVQICFPALFHLLEDSSNYLYEILQILLIIASNKRKNPEENYLKNYDQQNSISILLKNISSMSYKSHEILTNLLS